MSEKYKRPTKTNNKTPTKPTNKTVDEKLDPVRYGDWEKNGRCIDF